MAAKWDSETTLKFIQKYKQLECLWNYESPMYKDRDMRYASYLELIGAMDLADFGILEAKNKIKNLRSTYNQEKKKCEESKKTAPRFPLYKSNIKWLHEMEPIMNMADKKKGNENGDDTQNASDNSDNEDPLLTPIPAQSSIQCPPPPKRRKIKPSQEINHRTSVNNSEDGEEDSFDAFGHSVAKQLRKLTEERALLAQSAIQNLLTEYGIEDLREKKAAWSFNHIDMQ